VILTNPVQFDIPSKLHSFGYQIAVSHGMKKPGSPAADKSLPKETALTIGGTAGKVAALASSVTTRIRKGVGRIPTRDKARLPRRAKKALARAALTSAQLRRISQAEGSL
jgi:hypothetical protein